MQSFLRDCLKSALQHAKDFSLPLEMTTYRVFRHFLRDSLEAFQLPDYLFVTTYRLGD